MARDASDLGFCDVIIRDRGPAEHPEFTVEVDSTYNEDFKEAIKELPRDVRAWDGAQMRWRVHPRFLLNVEELAKKYFRRARRINGTIVTDLHSGNTYEQGALFQCRRDAR